MEGYLEHQLICRACLRVVENKTQSFGYIEDSYGNLKDMIMCCVPEMDIYVSSQPIICLPCIQQLITVYHFKTRCLNTETVIRSYMHRNNLKEYNHVNLGCVVQELVKMNTGLHDINQNKPVPQPPLINLEPLDNQGGLVVQPEMISEKELCSLTNNETSSIKLEDNHLDLEDKHRVDAGTNESSTKEHNSSFPETHRTVQCIPMPPHLVPHNFPYPHMVHRRIIPSNYMGERVFPFPPYPMGERLPPPPHLIFDHKFRPHHFPVLRPQFPEKVFMSPQFGLQHGFVQRCMVPEGAMYPPVGNGEKSVQQYAVEKNQAGDKGILPNSTEENTQNEVDNTSGVLSTISNGDLDQNKREQMQSDKSVENNSDCSGSEDENRDKETSEKDANSGGDENSEESGTKRDRIILRIDKSRIREFFENMDKNEDSNEKENKEQDVDMEENELLLSENGLFLHPADPLPLQQCTNCSFVTTNSSTYLSHKESCNGLEKNELKCPHCPHVTNRQNALKKHINTMHTKAVWYHCDYCTYKSTDSSCLRRHKRNVHSEKVTGELTCRICQYHCTTEYHLRKHMLKHDENSILHCQFCSYATRDRSNFRKHIFIHNPKPKECEFCDYKCVSPYQMKLHLKKYHHGVGLEDIDCQSDVSLSEIVDDISNAIKEAKSFAGHVTE